MLELSERRNLSSEAAWITCGYQNSGYPHLSSCHTGVTQRFCFCYEFICELLTFSNFELAWRSSVYLSFLSAEELQLSFEKRRSPSTVAATL